MSQREYNLIYHLGPLCLQVLQKGQHEGKDGKGHPALGSSLWRPYPTQRTIHKRSRDTLGCPNSHRTRQRILLKVTMRANLPFLLCPTS